VKISEIVLWVLERNYLYIMTADSSKNITKKILLHVFSNDVLSRHSETFKANLHTSPTLTGSIFGFMCQMTGKRKMSYSLMQELIDCEQIANVSLKVLLIWMIFDSMTVAWRYCIAAKNESIVIKLIELPNRDWRHLIYRGLLCRSTVVTFW
jgi:hypothetical protein